MKTLHHLFRFYIHSSIHVAMAVVALAFLTAKELHIVVDIMFLAFVFFATITGYNFVKYAAIAKLYHRSLTKSLRSLQVFSLLCFLCFLYLVWQLPVRALVLVAVVGGLTVLYALPVFSKKRNLRALPGIKVGVIALVWAVFTVWLPVSYGAKAFDIEVVALFVQRFLFVLVLLFPFEIRDLPYDSSALGTIPQVFGVQNTKRLGYLLLVVVVLLELALQTHWTSVVVTAMVCVLLGLLVFFSKKHQPAYYASFWVEAVPVFWLVLDALAGLL